MPDGSDVRTESDTTGGISAVVALLRFHGVAAEVEQTRHAIATSGYPPAETDVVRHLRRAGLKARAVYLGQSGLTERTPLPALALRRDGGLVLLARITADQVLVLDPAVDRPALLPRAQFDADWSGRLVLAARRARLSDLDRRFGLGWFLGAMAKYRWVLGEVLAASLALQVFGLVSPLFFQAVVDKVLVHRGLDTLDVLMVGFIGIAVFETVLGMLRTYVFAHTTNRIDVELGARLFRHLLALPLAYFGARRVGDSVARVRELENIRSFLTGSALTLVVDLSFTGVFLAVMLAYSPLLTAVVVASLPVYAVLSAAATPLFRARLDDKYRRGAENQAFLVEVVAGVETLKAMAVEPQMQRRWEEGLAGYVTASMRVANLGNIAGQAVQLVGKLTTVAVLWLGARAVIDGSMTVGGLVAFNMLSGRVAQPVLRLAQLWQDFHQARLSVDRLGDILNTPPEPGSGGSKSVLPPIRGSVQFDRLRFRHRLDGPLVLDEVSLDVRPGEVIGLVGPSGSGKSTLTKLLQRLYVPEAGRVLVDGVDIAAIDPAWLRRQIGVVLQESVLLNASVRDNIALADPGMSMQRVTDVARLAGAHDFILELPDGYDTILGERGGSLSGGQRQRIAIARALATGPRILIFDEATSALDYESERLVQQNLRQICQGRTVFIVAHRLSAVRHANRIVVMERGRLVEQGTHEELLRTGGHYAALLRMQGGSHGVG